jgi:hypothetical protein
MTRPANPTKYQIAANPLPLRIQLPPLYAPHLKCSPRQICSNSPPQHRQVLILSTLLLGHQMTFAMVQVKPPSTHAATEQDCSTKRKRYSSVNDAIPLLEKRFKLSPYNACKVTFTTQPAAPKEHSASSTSRNTDAAITPPKKECNVSASYSRNVTAPSTDEGYHTFSDDCTATNNDDESESETNSDDKERESDDDEEECPRKTHHGLLIKSNGKVFNF